MRYCLLEVDMKKLNCADIMNIVIKYDESCKELYYNIFKNMLEYKDWNIVFKKSVNLSDSKFFLDSRVVENEKVEICEKNKLTDRDSYFIFYQIEDERFKRKKDETGYRVLLADLETNIEDHQFNHLISVDVNDDGKSYLHMKSMERSIGSSERLPYRDPIESTYELSSDDAQYLLENCERFATTNYNV